MNREQMERMGAFFDRVYERLKRGTADYGDESFSATPVRLIDEVLQELEDVAGWGFILWYRLGVIQRALIQAVPAVAEQSRRSPEPSAPPPATQRPARAPEPVPEPPSAVYDGAAATVAEPAPVTIDALLDKLVERLARIPMAPVMGATIDAEKPVAPKSGNPEVEAGFRPEHPVARIKANLERWRPEWRKGVAQNPPSNAPGPKPPDPLADLGFHCSKCAGHFTYDALSEKGAAGQDLCMNCAEVKE